MAVVHTISSSPSFNPFSIHRSNHLQRSSLCYKGNVFRTRELNTLHELSSWSSKKNSLILACCFEAIPKIRVSLARSIRYQTGPFQPAERPSRVMALTSCHVKKEESMETSSGESIVVDQETLERDLQIAIEEEDYGLAANIRDKLKVLHEDSKASVLAANARFYNAFKLGDLAVMQTLWTEEDYVCCVHPGINGISGYDLVMSSWEYVLANYEFPLEIEVKDVIVHVKGDVGLVTCMEFIKTKGSSWGKQSVTNVFEKIKGQWFMCIHHASSSSFDK